MMLALLLVLAVAAVYVGTIETAFSALMRLSLRLEKAPDEIRAASEGDIQVMSQRIGSAMKAAIGSGARSAICLGTSSPMIS